jgi:hypothetical protein
MSFSNPNYTIDPHLVPVAGTIFLVKSAQDNEIRGVLKPLNLDSKVDPGKGQ